MVSIVFLTKYLQFWFVTPSAIDTKAIKILERKFLSRGYRKSTLSVFFFTSKFDGTLFSYQNVFITIKKLTEYLSVSNCFSCVRLNIYFKGRKSVSKMNFVVSLLSFYSFIIFDVVCTESFTYSL